MSGVGAAGSAQVDAGPSRRGDAGRRSAAAAADLTTPGRSVPNRFDADRGGKKKITERRLGENQPGFRSLRLGVPSDRPRSGD